MEGQHFQRSLGHRHAHGPLSQDVRKRTAASLQ